MRTFRQFYFTAKELSKVHSQHLEYLIAAGHACNELNAVRIYLVFEQQDVLDKPVEKAFVTIRQLVLIRHLTAKIFEFNNLTTKYFGQIRNTFPSMALRWRADYVPIAQAIRKNIWLPELRNKQAFHFDGVQYLAQLRSLKPTQELSMMIGSTQGEMAFSFAEEIVSLPYFSKVGNGDTAAGLEKIATFANQVSSQILEFYSQFSISIFEHYGLFHKNRDYTPDVKSAGIPGRDAVPVFVSDDVSLRKLRKPKTEK